MGAENQGAVKNGHGGKRVGAGRKPGSKDMATLELEAAARALAPDALAALKFVALRGKSESARVQASTVLLDRGYGKARQSIEHSGSISIPQIVIE